MKTKSSNFNYKYVKNIVLCVKSTKSVVGSWTEICGLVVFLKSSYKFVFTNLLVGNFMLLYFWHFVMKHFLIFALKGAVEKGFNLL